MTHLVLVRHGESEWHSENRYAGSSDVALTSRGVQQARQLSRWAADAGLAEVWSSDLSRARLTATLCAKASAVPIRVDQRLRELDFGEGEGMTAAEMVRQFPEALEAFRADPVGDHLPGGENPVQAAARFVACLHDIHSAHPDGRVLVVAHTTAIRLALCQLIGVPLSHYRRLFPFLRNCALTEIRLEGDHVSVVEFNAPLERVVDGPPEPLDDRRPQVRPKSGGRA